MGFNRPFTAGTNTLLKTFTQLTAPGSTTAEVVEGLSNHTFAVTIAAIDTTVVFSIQGSVDGTTFFDMESDTTDVTGITTAATNLITSTADGTFPFIFKNYHVRQIRFDFDSETGGTAATIDVAYAGVDN